MTIPLPRSSQNFSIASTNFLASLFQVSKNNEIATQEARGKALRGALQYGDAYFEESGDLIPFRFMIRRPSYRERIDTLRKELEKKRGSGGSGDKS